MQEPHALAYAKMVRNAGLAVVCWIRKKKKKKRGGGDKIERGKEREREREREREKKDSKQSGEYGTSLQKNSCAK